MSKDQKEGRDIFHFSLRAAVYFGLIFVPALVLAGIDIITALGWFILIVFFGVTYTMFTKSMSMNYPPEGRRATAMWPFRDRPPRPPPDG